MNRKMKYPRGSGLAVMALAGLFVAFVAIMREVGRAYFVPDSPPAATQPSERVVMETME